MQGSDGQHIIVPWNPEAQKFDGEWVRFDQGELMSQLGVDR